MTLLVEKGTFQKTTSTSTPVSQQVTLSNSSLTPKVIWLWTTGQTTIDGTYTEDARFCYGFSDISNDCCICTRVDDSARTEANTLRNDSIISIIDLTTNTIVSQADVSAVAAGSFTLNWSVQSNTQALHIHYMVAGGTDITNVSVFQTTVGATSTGNKSYNGSGTTFTPDFGIMITGPDGNPTLNAVNTSLDNSAFSIGAAISTTKRWVVWKRDETVGTSDSDMYISSSAISFVGANTTGAQTGLADFASFNNSAGGGITINVSDGYASATCPFFFLLIKGGTWDVGTFQQRSGTGTQDVTLTTNLDPALVFLAGINTATSGSVQLSSYLGVGGSDGTNEGASWAGSQSDVATYATASADTNQKVFRHTTPSATVGSSTTNSECDMNDMATASKFQLNWTTADSTLRQMAFWALGSIAAGNAVERALATETISISEASVARLKGSIRTRSETVTLSDNRARLAAKNRAPGTETITLSENVIRIKGKIKTLATETITVAAGTLAKQMAKIRSGSDTVVISETPTRLAAKNRAPATQTIALSDSVARVKGKIKSLATETVAIAENLARLCAKIRAPATQTISLSDNRARVKGSIRALATQTISLSENLARVLGRNITRAVPTQTVSISENLARTKGLTKTIATQTVTVGGGTITRLTAKIRTLSQSVTISENLERTIAGANDIVRSITESVTVTAGILTKALTQTRSITDTITITGPVTRVKGVNRPLFVSTPLSDSLTRLKGSIKAISQSVPTAETLQRLLSQIRTISESVIIADNVQRFINIVQQNIERTAEDAITILETLQIYVVRAAERFRKIRDPSVWKLKSNHPAWLLGTRGMHDHYEEFSP